MAMHVRDEAPSRKAPHVTTRSRSLHSANYPHATQAGQAQIIAYNLPRHFIKSLLRFRRRYSYESTDKLATTPRGIVRAQH
jgi:hypothetical protein